MNTTKCFAFPTQRVATILAVAALALASARAVDEQTIDIQCSPAVVNLSSPGNGTWFTVHADIPYSLVQKSSVTLNGLPVKWTKADNRGNLVAKFPLNAVRGLLQPGPNLLTLSGTTRDGGMFAGSAVVQGLYPMHRGAIESPVAMPPPMPAPGL